ASSGIGYALARVFAQHGYDLVLVARRREALEALASELSSQFHISAQVLTQDLSAIDAPLEISEELHRRGILVDVLVNNAGFGIQGPFVEADETTQLQVMQVNIVALTRLTRLLLPGMLQRGYGRILNVASTAAFLPGPLMAIYYASKAYVLSFSEAIANELAGTGVTVTVLAPGPTASGFQAAASLEDSKLVAGKTLATSRDVAFAAYEG